MTVITGGYLRTTVLTRHRTLDIVLPTHRPVAELMPGIVELLAYDTEGTACVLHTSQGHTLEMERPLAQSGFADGVLLHLVAEHEAPSEPVVADVLDLLESQPPHAGWSIAARAWTLSALGATLVALGLALWASDPGADHALRTALSALVLLVASALASLVGRTPLAWSAATLSATAAGSAVAISHVEPPQAWLCAAGVLLVAIAAVAWCARHSAAALTAALTWAVLVGGASAAWATGGGVLAASAVLLMLSSVTLGLLPRSAMSLSGLFSVDARIAAGHQVHRAHVAAVVGQAHRALAGAVVVCSVGFGAGGVALARHQAGNPWVIALVVLSLTSWFTRARHFPLAVQRIVMVSSGVVVLAGLAWGLVGTDTASLPWMITSLMAGGTVVMAAEAIPISALNAAQLRRSVQQVEAVAIVATPACLLGMFDVYSDLLRTF